MIVADQCELRNATLAEELAKANAIGTLGVHLPTREIFVNLRVCIIVTDCTLIKSEYLLETSSVMKENCELPPPQLYRQNRQTVPTSNCSLVSLLNKMDSRVCK